jgi:hypothetical protein
MRAKANRCPPAFTTEIHYGTPMSAAFAMAARMSFIAPSHVSFSEAVVSVMGTYVIEPDSIPRAAAQSMFGLYNGDRLTLP